MQATTSEKLQLISSAFKDGDPIPPAYTCKGQNINPPLNILNIPGDTRSLALIMHDPDAVSGDFVHWLVWDISTAVDIISPNSVPVGAIQGQNGAGKDNYMGPCPPSGSGTHHYIFELYALDSTLGVPKGATRESLQKAMEGHILAQTTLTGLFSG